MYHFIINLRAQSGHGRHIWNIVENVLYEKNISYHAHYTEYPFHASFLAKRLSHTEEHRVIIAIGGDGTINEVINGFLPKENLFLGYIPAGSSNDLARSLGISSNPLKALETILLSRHILYHDIGNLQCRNMERPYMVSCGIGFDAAICHEAMTSKLKKFLNKIRLGKLTYVGIAFKLLTRYQPQTGTIILDNKKKIKHSKILFISIQNHRFEGGGFMFCPDARADDQLLDVCIIEGIPKWKIPFLLPTALKGRHLFHHGVHVYQCKKADIRMKTPLPVHVDGEVCGKYDFLRVSCRPKPINFIIE